MPPIRTVAVCSAHLKDAVRRANSNCGYPTIQLTTTEKCYRGHDHPADYYLSVGHRYLLWED